jgi:hypothetical protein
VTFKVKDYRIDGPGRYKTMTLDAHEQPKLAINNWPKTPLRPDLPHPDTAAR